jgi:menaquinone-dependent protoporphyrinogen IX oxidase
VVDSVTKYLCLYYSSCGHIEILASAVANRLRDAGVDVAPTPLATVAELASDAPVLLAPSVRAVEAAPIEQ